MNRPSPNAHWPLFILLLALTACGQSKDRVRIEGKFTNIGQAEFYIYSEDGALDAIDTVRIEDGEFSYERQLKDTAVLTLLYPNFSEMYIVAAPGASLNIEGNAGRLGETAVSGTPDNEELTKFRLDHLHKPMSDVRLAAAEYIRSHAGSWAAIVLFKQYFAKDNGADPATSLSLLEALLKARKNNPGLIAIGKMLRPLLRNGVGQKLTPFSARTLDGQTVRLTDYAGKPLLITFWATWSNECTARLDLLRRYEQLYGNKMGFLHISLDADIERCRRQVKMDTLRSPVVCDGEAFDSPLLEKLGVRYVPGTILVDANGIITARDIPQKDLRDALEKAIR